MIKKPNIKKIGDLLAFRPTVRTTRDPVAYAAALKILG
jgi:hypothetical protein